MEVHKLMAKGKSLASREDFMIEQLVTMKKVNSMMSRLFEIYYIDVQPGNQLSTMMLTVWPRFYVDPLDPEYPSQYTIVGKSLVPYLERAVFINPYVGDKGKLQWDLSAYKGLVFNSAEFQMKAKLYRKTKLEPYIIMGDQKDGSRYTQSVLMKEPGMKKSETLVIPGLNLPSRQLYGVEAHRAMLQKIVYDAYYRFIFDYLKDPSLVFHMIPDDVIEGVKEEYAIEYTTHEGDIITLSKEIIPQPTVDHKYSLAWVENAHVEPGCGKRHYLLAEDYETPNGMRYMSVYTLFAILSLLDEAYE